MLLWLVNKETALGLVIGQNLGRQGDRTEFWEEKGKERTAMELPGQTCRIFPCKPRPRSDIQIIRNGLNQDVRASQQEARANGQAMF